MFLSSGGMLENFLSCRKGAKDPFLSVQMEGVISFKTPILENGLISPVGENLLVFLEWRLVPLD